MTTESVAERKLQEHLAFIYGEERAVILNKRILDLVVKFQEKQTELPLSNQANSISEKDVILIAYGDIIKEIGTPPLRTLLHFLDEHLAGKINAVHILPFYPYSSDDGFSVIDYRAVDPSLGNWNDIRELAKSYKLMIDVVINHVSSESSWFKSFLNGDPVYQNFFILPDEAWDLSAVARPRTSPLLTTFETSHGLRKVWTTFSSDQIDLNYANPEVLLEIVDLLLFYVSQGASIIRLDAIAYLWKQSGTTCVHLPQTHRVVKIMRLVLEMAAPHVVLITETNVPHKDNISYFGDHNPGTGLSDEAHMVYQFPLPPLVLHTLQAGSSAHIHNWVESLDSEGLFFNFIASHDGIGVLPASGILSEEEVESIIDQVKNHGGLVSYRSNPDGTQTAYELNATLYDTLNDPYQPDPYLDVARFIASQVIMLSLAGVPGVYYHSLFGSRNSVENVKRTDLARSINREKFSRNELETVLNDPGNVHAQVFEKYRHLLSIRTKQAAFHPNGRQRVIRLSDRVFGLERESPDQSSAILTLVNICPEQIRLSLDLSQGLLNQSRLLEDLISGGKFKVFNRKLSIKLKPYQPLWLKNFRIRRD